MGNDEPQSVRPAFARVVRRVLIGFAALAAVGFAVGSERLLHYRARDAALDQAELCVAALSPGPNGDLSAAVDRLTTHSDRLAAVATLNPSGEVQTVYGDSPAYRKAAVAAARTDSAVTRVPGGNGETLWAITLSVHGSSGPAAWRVIFLLRHASYLEVWLIAMGVFLGVLTVVSAGTLGLLTRWFDRAVVSALGRLGEVEGIARFSGAGRSPVGRSEWRETHRIARKLQELAERAEKSERRCRRIEYEAEQQIDRHRKRLNRRLRRAEDQATTDALTGLRNRRFLDEELEPLFDHQRARGQDLAVVMLDVDNFKDLNDTQGHEAGDEILQFLGELLRAAVRPADHAVRYGGDEMVLLLPGVNARQAVKIAERIVRLFAQYISPFGDNSSLSLSAGVAAFRSDPCTAGHELLTKADAALYHAKRSGKNQVSASATV